MKRILAFILVLALMVTLVGCLSVHEPILKPSLLQTEAPATKPSDSPTLSTEPSTTITDSTEPSVEPKDDDFVRVIDCIPTIRQDLAYATENNFTGQVIYDFEDAYLRYGTVKKLAQVCEELAQQGLGVLIWDGYRPVYAQAALWEVCPDPTYVSPPGTGIQSHCRGIAVDLTLVDLETGEELVMPTGFDDFSSLADRDYTDCSPDAAANAVLLENVMEKYGFAPYSGEWWHFSDTQVYPVEEVFDPANAG